MAVGLAIYLNDPRPLGVRHQVGNGFQIHAVKRIVVAPGNWAAESAEERRTRLLAQALMNLSNWDEVVWDESLSDPDSGEWLMDVFHVPSQWHLGDGGRPEERHHVVFTPSGCRCDCPWAEHHPDLLGDSGSTEPCSHTELARFMRYHRLINPQLVAP